MFNTVQYTLDIKTRRFMKIVAIFFLSLIEGLVFAQDIEITVLNKKSEPMPYAYILRNWKPITVTDTAGKAVVPLKSLNDKDTLSVSYLGAQQNWVLFDDSIKNTKHYCFYLDESGYKLNEVVVTYQDIEKLFRNSFKSLPVLNYNCTMSAEFDFKITLEDKRFQIPENYELPVSGVVEAKNDIKFKPRHYLYFDPPLNFMTDDDTLKLNSSLNFNTHYALWFANLSINLCQQRRSWAKSFLTYLGEKENFKVFRITYSKSLFQKFYYQIILYVDKQTKYLKNVEIDAYNDEPVQPPLNNYQYRFNLKYDCELYTNQKPKRPTIYFPTNINYSFRTIDYRTIDLRLSNLKIKI